MEPTDLFLLDEAPVLDLRSAIGGDEISVTITHVDSSGLCWTASERVSVDSQNSSYLLQALMDQLSPVATNRASDLWQIATDPAHYIGQPSGGRLQHREFQAVVRSGDQHVYSKTFKQTRIAPHVKTSLVSELSVIGKLYEPAQPNDPDLGIMVITSSGGGIEESFAPLLASRGFRTFSPAYFNFKGRPTTLENIDLEYFVKAAEWMSHRMGVRKIVLQGSSKGGELALLINSYFPWCFAGVAAQSPWNTALGFPEFETESPWTLGGHRLTALPINLSLGEKDGEGTSFANAFESALDSISDTHPSIIPVERITGRVFLASGEDDQFIGSAHAVTKVFERVQHRNPNPSNWEAKVYKDAGHYLPPPGLPSLFCSKVFFPQKDMALNLGGTPMGTANAGRDLWADMLDYFSSFS